MQLSIHVSDQILILVQLVAAMLLGGLIGLDREAADKPAGLRTHILDAGASAYFSSDYSVLILSASATLH